MHPDQDPAAIPDKPTEQALPELIGVARDADHAIRRLARLTTARPSVAPADVSVVLAHLADTLAAIPQVAAQLSDILDRATHDYRLSMDAMTEIVDPDIAIDTARLSPRRRPRSSSRPVPAPRRRPQRDRTHQL